MNTITSNKSVLITIAVSLILLGFFYIAGANKKEPVRNGNLPSVTNLDEIYYAFQDAQSQDDVFLELSLNNGVGKLKSISLNDNTAIEEIGKYTDDQKGITLTLDFKDGKPLESTKILKFAKHGPTLKLTNNVEARFGNGQLLFQKPTNVLGGTSWNWEKSEYANATDVEPADKTKFKLSFSKDGTFESSTDCNSLSGRYYIVGSELRFSTMMSTLRFCEDSLETEYSKDLRKVHSFLIEESGLTLGLEVDSGHMQFVKAQN
jgi:heat shock protein HslJ